MIYDMDNIKERIEELEVLESEADENDKELFYDVEAELNNLREFAETVRNEDDDIVDALLEYYRNDKDVLTIVGDIVKNKRFSEYEDVEEYGRMIVDELEPEVPTYIRSYVDFEGFAQDSLSGQDYVETGYGKIIILY